MENSTVYGPVKSWRFGRSLGIDLIVEKSVCSFNCIYCQLGRIQEITTQQRVFVSTERVLADLAVVRWDEVDVVTISGSGEPTLALNLGEVIAHLRHTVQKPVTVLTNATLLGDAATRHRLLEATTVSCKLDAWDDEMLGRFNRAAAGVTMAGILEGIAALRAEFRGRLALQVMLMPMNVHGAAEIARLAATLNPDEVQLNTPTRPYPRAWDIHSRGNHTLQPGDAAAALQCIDGATAAAVERTFREHLPHAHITSVHHPGD